MDRLGIIPASWLVVGTIAVAAAMALSENLVDPGWQRGTANAALAGQQAPGLAQEAVRRNAAADAAADDADPGAAATHSSLPAAADKLDAPHS